MALSRLGDALLLLARAESGQLITEQDWFDMAPWLRQQVEHWQRLAPTCRIAVELDINDRSAQIFIARGLSAEGFDCVTVSELHQVSMMAYQHQPDVIVQGNVTLDLASRNGQVVPLTSLEFELLAFLMQHNGKALSRERILNKVWGLGYRFRANADR